VYAKVVCGDVQYGWKLSWLEVREEDEGEHAMMGGKGSERGGGVMSIRGAGAGPKGKIDFLPSPSPSSPSPSLSTRPPTPQQGGGGGGGGKGSSTDGVELVADVSVQSSAEVVRLRLNESVTVTTLPYTEGETAEEMVYLSFPSHTILRHFLSASERREVGERMAEKRRGQSRRRQEERGVDGQEWSEKRR